MEAEAGAPARGAGAGGSDCCLLDREFIYAIHEEKEIAIVSEETLKEGLYGGFITKNTNIKIREGDKILIIKFKKSNNRARCKLFDEMRERIEAEGDYETYVVDAIIYTAKVARVKIKEKYVAIEVTERSKINEVKVFFAELDVDKISDIERKKKWLESAGYKVAAIPWRWKRYNALAAAAGCELIEFINKFFEKRSAASAAAPPVLDIDVEDVEEDTVEIIEVPAAAEAQPPVVSAEELLEKEEEGSKECEPANLRKLYILSFRLPSRDFIARYEYRKDKQIRDYGEDRRKLAAALETLRREFIEEAAGYFVYNDTLQNWLAFREEDVERAKSMIERYRKEYEKLERKYKTILEKYGKSLKNRVTIEVIEIYVTDELFNRLLQESIKKLNAEVAETAQKIESLKQAKKSVTKYIRRLNLRKALLEALLSIS